MQHLENYLKSLSAARDLSPHTLRAYRTDLLRWETSLLPDERSSPLNVGPTEVKSYLQQLLSDGMSRSSVARHLSAIKGYLKFVQAMEGADDHPASSIRLPKRSRSLPHVLTQEQMEQLLNVKSPDPVLDARDRAALETLYSSGVRVSELVAMDCASVDLSSGLARVMGKGRRERLVMIGSHAVRAISDWLLFRDALRTEEAGDALFLHHRGGRLSDRSVRRLLDRAILRAGLGSGVTPHTLRHSFATHLLAAGAGLKDVQQMLGHRLLSSTQIYTHISPQHLRLAYEAAHPRAHATS
ncbi:MAG TPA: tyrosine recombinase XerC [Planctomycetota bacterium]|nr:tyrosine recombinase XerC [Planctomycetota bacterium]